MTSDKQLKIRGLKDALDGLPVGHPMRAAINVGLNHLLDPEQREPPPADTRPRDISNQPVSVTVKITTDRYSVHNPKPYRNSND